MEVTFRAQIWIYSGQGAWHFVTVPRDDSRRIRAAATAQKLEKNFGTVRLVAMTGASRWSTSVFWDSKREAYVLPLKAGIRGKEPLRDGDMVDVTLLFELEEPPG